MLNTWAVAPTKDEKYKQLGFIQDPLIGEYISQYKNGGKINKFAPGGALAKMNSSSAKAAEKAFSSENLGSTLGGALGGVTTLVDNAMKNAEVDTSEADNALEATKSFQTDNSSLDALANSYNSAPWAETDYNFKDFRPGAGELAMNTVSSVVSGASTGASMGGVWGAVAGAAVGLGSALGGIFAGRAKAQKEEARLEAESKIANKAIETRAEASRDALLEQQANQTLMNVAAEGGKINIKPSKVGTFTAAAERRNMGVQEFANKVLKNKERYSSEMVKKANFAKNASHWKHSYGGDLNFSGDFSNNVIFIDEGGTHEQNPFEGVLMGFDNEGTPNLVEQGEVIYKDYVFSNRLKANKKGLENIGFSDKYKDWTFAKIAEDLQKESAERPNDILSKQTLDDMMGRLISVQEEVRMKKQQRKQNKFNLGGKVNKFYLGEDDMSNPMDPNQNYRNYMFDVGQQEAEAQAAAELARLQQAFFEKENAAQLNNTSSDPLGLGSFPTLAETQAAVDKQGAVFSKARENALLEGATEDEAILAGDNAVMSLLSSPSSNNNDSNFDWGKFGNDMLRMGAPIAAGIAGLAQNLKKPDYSQNERALNEARTAPTSNIVAPTEDISIRPIDTNYMANMLRNQGNSVISNINNMGLNAQQAMANQMLTNNQIMSGVADAYLKANDTNLARFMQENEFNRGNDQFRVSTQFQNFANNAARHNRIIDETARAAAANSALDAARAQGIYAAESNLAESLAGIGSENHWSDVINKNPSLLYTTTGNYKNSTTASGKYGGLLTKSKKRRK